MLVDLQLSVSDVRRQLQRRGVALSAGMTRLQVLRISVTGPLIRPAVTQVARKLRLALYYKHCSTPLPRTGALWTRRYTNWNMALGECPEERRTLRPAVPEKMRNRVDLSP